MHSLCSASPAVKLAPANATQELDAGERLFSERFTPVDFRLFGVRSANAHANENIVFQNIERAPNPIRRPISCVAEAIYFLRRRCFFFLRLAETFLLFLVPFFFLCSALVAAKRLLPIILGIAPFGSTRIALSDSEADRFVKGLSGIETLRDSKTTVGLFAAFGVLDRRALDGLDFLISNQLTNIDLLALWWRGSSFHFLAAGECYEQSD